MKLYDVIRQTLLEGWAKDGDVMLDPATVERVFTSDEIAAMLEDGKLEVMKDGHGWLGVYYHGTPNPTDPDTSVSEPKNTVLVLYGELEERDRTPRGFLERLMALTGTRLYDLHQPSVQVQVEEAVLRDGERLMVVDKKGVDMSANEARALAGRILAEQFRELQEET